MSAPLVRKVLVVGAGYSGMAAAILLRRLGAAVDLVEIDPSWRSEGVAIGIGSATLQAFRRLGILDGFLAQACRADTAGMMAPDGQPLQAAGSPPGRAAAAMLRPALSRLLADATLAAGVEVRLGLTVTSVRQDDAGVNVEFTGARGARYDLLVGADGLYSKMRETLLRGAPRPVTSGRTAWCALLPRAAGLERTTWWLGRDIDVALHPLSPAQMYLSVHEARATATAVRPEQLLLALKGLLERSPLQEVRALVGRLEPGAPVAFRALASLELPPPWYSGRALLIGAAVHGAGQPWSGACPGLDDAVVLAEELAQASSIATALERYQQRRWQQCRPPAAAGPGGAEARQASTGKRTERREKKDP